MKRSGGKRTEAEEESSELIVKALTLIRSCRPTTKIEYIDLDGGSRREKDRFVE